MTSKRIRKSLSQKRQHRLGNATKQSSTQSSGEQIHPKSRSGTLLGNVIYSKYIDNTNWLNKALNPKKIAQLEKLSALFSRYGEKYNLDYLLIAAVAYKESGFNNNLVGTRGAVGIMQVLPSTARDPNINIKMFDNSKTTSTQERNT